MEDRFTASEVNFGDRRGGYLKPVKINAVFDGHGGEVRPKKSATETN